DCGVHGRASLTEIGVPSRDGHALPRGAVEELPWARPPAMGGSRSFLGLPALPMIRRAIPSPFSLALGAVVFLAIALPAADGAAMGHKKGCPAGMASILGKFCIDKFEASTVEILPGGKTRPHSPYAPVEGLKVKAVSKRGIKPQAYISRDEA